MKKYDAKPLPPLDPNMDASKNHYWSYQGLDALLACKRPLTASQDEDLFIAVHQICEIAFHQIILDLDRTLDALKRPSRRPRGRAARSTKRSTFSNGRSSCGTR